MASRPPFRRRCGTLRLERDETLMSRQAESDQPGAKKILKPSPEVAAKMRPLEKREFQQLLQRAVSQPAQKPALKHR